MITEPGPNKILTEQTDEMQLKSIFSRVEISLNKHQSNQIAVVGHYDCAGNPAPKNVQIEHIKKSIEAISQKYPNTEIIGLWVNEKWRVEEVT